MAQVEQIIKVRVIDEEALKDLSQLQASLVKNREAQQALTKAYKSGEITLEQYSKETVVLKNENKQLSQSQAQLTKEAKATAGSYNDLSARMARLKKEQKNVNVTTKEGQAAFDKYAKEINDTNNQLKALDAKNGVYTRNVGNYKSAIAGAAGQLNIMGVNVSMLTTQMATAQTAIVGMTSATGGATKAMKVLKIAIASTGIGALILALGSLISYFTSTREGGETIRVIFAQIGQVVNVLVERLTVLGKGIVQIVSGNFKSGVETLTGAFKGLGDELEREVRLIGELERKAIKLEKAEILLNAQRSNTNRQIKQLQLLAEDETQTLETRQSALQKAIKLQQELNNLEIKVQRQKIKNILAENGARAKTDFVFQMLDEGFTNITEAANKADAIIDQIGLDPSTVDDLKDLVDEYISFKDTQASALKQERTLQTRLNSLNREANKEQKSGVAGVVAYRKDNVAMMHEEEAMLEELEIDINNQDEAVNELDKTRNEYFDNWLNGIIDTTVANDDATNKELDNLEKIKRAREQITQTTITGLESAGQFAGIIADFQTAAMQRELLAAGDNAKKREQIEKKYAERQKKIAITQSLINGALAITKTYANLGFPAGLPASLLVAAQTAAQVALISSKQFEKGGILEEFANGGIAQTGGMLQGASHANGGIPFKVGGRVGFEAEGGEAIINKKSSAMFRPVLSAINQAGGGKAFEFGGTLPSSTTANIDNMFNMKELAKSINQIKVVLPVPSQISAQNELNALEVNNRYA